MNDSTASRDSSMFRDEEDRSSVVEQCSAASSEHTKTNTTAGEESSDEILDVDDNDLTVIVLDRQADAGDFSRRQEVLDWIDQAGPEMEERRRLVLMRELQRVQRASFLHFVLLCSIPTALLVVVLVTVLGGEESCQSDATICELEPRTFINAFTTRCVCEAISVDSAN